MTQPDQSLVRFTPYGANGGAHEPIVMSYEDFYEGTDSPVDDSEWIRTNRVIAIAIEVYGDRGKFQSFSINIYDDQGRLANGKIVHADGTVQTHPNR